MKLLFLGLFFSIINCFVRGKKSVYIVFLGVLLVMGFQGKAGYDYLSYEKNFNLIGSNIININNNEFELGWYLLNSLFSHAEIPFSFFVLFIAFVQYLILCKFVSAYVRKSAWYNFSFVLFFFVISYLGFQLTGLRQGFAIELIALAFFLLDNAVKKKNLLLGYTFFLIAYSMHHSALVILPFLILFTVKRNLSFFDSSRFLYIMCIVFFLAYALKSSILSYLSAILPNDSEYEYLGYFNQFELQFQLSKLIVFYDFIMIVFVCWFARHTVGSLRFFCLLSIISLFGEVLIFGMNDLPRILYYFSIFNIVVFPNIAILLKKKYNMYYSLCFVCICCGYAIKTFLPAVMNPSLPRMMDFKFIFEL